jgi:hypothetical protein
VQRKLLSADITFPLFLKYETGLNYSNDKAISGSPSLWVYPESPRDLHSLWRMTFRNYFHLCYSSVLPETDSLRYLHTAWPDLNVMEMYQQLEAGQTTCPLTKTFQRGDGFQAGAG